MQGRWAPRLDHVHLRAAGGALTLAATALAVAATARATAWMPGALIVPARLLAHLAGRRRRVGGR